MCCISVSSVRKLPECQLNPTSGMTAASRGKRWMMPLDICMGALLMNYFCNGSIRPFKLWSAISWTVQSSSSKLCRKGSSQRFLGIMCLGHVGAWVVLGVPGVLGLQWAGILAGPIFPAWVFPSWFAWRQSWFTSQDISFDWFWANTVSWENETFPILGSSDLERMSWQKLSFGMGDWGSFGYSWFFSRQCLVVLE